MKALQYLIAIGLAFLADASITHASEELELDPRCDAVNRAYVATRSMLAGRVFS